MEGARWREHDGEIRVQGAGWREQKWREQGRGSRMVGTKAKEAG